MKAFAILFLSVSLVGFALSSSSSPSEFMNGFFSNVFSSLLERLWSLAPSAKSAIPSRSSVEFESGYHVDTVFDGSKLGIEPFSVEVLPSGDFVVLDSESSCIYRISSPLSLYSRPKLVAGSPEGYSGHADGKPREARMNHPKGLTVDDKGNIYIADTMNRAIRKISDAGVTTIAGGKWNRGSHVDGPSQDAKFSNDFEVVYIGSICSLLVVDRGNQAIREIQLHFDDCAYDYGFGFPLEIVLVFAAGFFGYMLAILQRRMGVIASFSNGTLPKASCSPSSYRQPTKPSVTPPLTASEENAGKQKEEAGFRDSVVTLITGIISSSSLILSGKSSKRIAQNYQHQNQQEFHSNSCPVQESFAVPEEESPPVEVQTPNPRKTYAFMSKDPEKLQHLRHGKAYFDGWLGEQGQQQQKHGKELTKHQQRSSGTETYHQES